MTKKSPSKKKATAKKTVKAKAVKAKAVKKSTAPKAKTKAAPSAKQKAQRAKIGKLGKTYNEAFYSALAGHKVSEADLRTARQSAKVAVRRVK